MKYKYETVYTNTLKGLKRAERLKARDWQIVYVSPVSIMFQKAVEKKERKEIESNGQKLS